MTDVRINMINRVNSASIKVETIDGEPHLVIPSYTLPDSVVMNGGMYPREEIDRAWPTINNTLAPIGHPTDDQGNWLSAFSPQAIHNFHGGAYNRNARRDGNRVYVEKVVNVRYAQQTEPGKRLLDAVRYNAETGTAAGPEKPIHTSTGLLLQQDAAPAGAPYQWIARNMRLDHDAILLDEPGAATPEQGVGMMVNCSHAVTVQNLADDSYQAREQMLGQAIAARFGGEAWVRDFDSEQAVFRRPEAEGGFAQIGYAMKEGGGVELVGDPVAVQPRTSWVKQVIANLWSAVVPSKTPITTNQPGEDDSMPLSKEDLEAIGTLIGNQLKPVTDRLDKHGEELTSLKTNSDALAGQLKSETEKRIEADKALVTEKHGEAIANALAPDKLAEVANALRAGKGADPLPNGERPQNNNDQAEWGLVPTVGGV